MPSNTQPYNFIQAEEKKIAIKKEPNLNRDRIFMVEQFIRTLHHIPGLDSFVCTILVRAFFTPFYSSSRESREPVIMLSVVARTFLHFKGWTRKISILSHFHAYFSDHAWWAPWERKKSNLQKWNAVCKGGNEKKIFTGENCMHDNWQWLKLMPNEVLLSPTILTLGVSPSGAACNFLENWV